MLIRVTCPCGHVGIVASMMDGDDDGGQAA
jgi:hypothetical protein